MPSSRKIKTLIVDDSAMIRRVLSLGFSADPRIEVVGIASNAEDADGMIRELKPDVITLDIELPGMNGVDFMRQYLGKHPIPTLIISSHSPSGSSVAISALEAGAVDVIEKPSAGLASGLSNIMGSICEAVVRATSSRVIPGRRMNKASQPALMQADSVISRWVFAIGSSTGGVQALSRILPMFPENSPGIVIVQHMPPGFTEKFAARLNDTCQMTVHEASDGDTVKRGKILLAPGGTQHMKLRKYGALDYRVTLEEGDPVNFSCPSVDVLFDSVAKEAGMKCSAALLTGMGRDGAQGLLNIRQAGGATIGQDEESCVVFGMPRAAQECGAVQTVVSLEDIPSKLLGSIGPANRETRKPNRAETTPISVRGNNRLSNRPA